MGELDLELIRIFFITGVLLVLVKFRHQSLFFVRQQGYHPMMAGFTVLVITTLLGSAEQSIGGLFPHLNALLRYGFTPVGVLLALFGLWRLVRSYAIMSDEQKQLKESTARISQTLEAGSDGTWDWDIANGRFEMSDNLLTMLGFSAEEVDDGLSFYQNRVHPDDLKILRDALISHFRGNPDFALQYRVKRANGDYLWILQHGKVVALDTDGRAQRMIGAITDISRLKQAEDWVSVVANGVSSEIGDDFFRSLSQGLVDALPIDVCMIAELTGDNNQQLHSISCMSTNGALVVENHNWHGTPCERPLEQGYTVVNNGVARLFPRYRLFPDLHINCFAGVPLRKPDGSVSGVLAIFGEIPFKDLPLMESMLQIFAVRASVELDRLRQEKALTQSQERYRAFIANSSEGIWRMDLIPPVRCDSDVDEQVKQIHYHSRMAECNQTVVDLHAKQSMSELLGKSLVEFVDEDLWPYTHKMFKTFVRENYRLESCETRSKGANGETRWTSTSLYGIVEDQQLTRIWGTQTDITSIKNHLAAVEEIASTDSLTGLPNRHTLYCWLQKKTDDPDVSRFALLLLDLDRFKDINDTLGHHCGDMVLKQIHSRLDNWLKLHDARLARLGGDEFAILLNHIESETVLMERAREVLAQLGEAFQLENFNVSVGGSIGVAVYPWHGKDESSLMRCADVAMYTAKQFGSGVEMYRTEHDHHSPQRLAMISDLGDAIRLEQLFLHYQPKLNVQNGSFSGVEVLVRWQHPHLGLVPPGHFIPIAETTELIRPLTAWVLDKSLQQWQAWQKLGIKTKMAVNVSVRNLLDEQLPVMIEGLLDRYDMEPRYLELELTESAIMSNPVLALKILERIHAMGVALSIDDFGTGYTSLSYLKRLPIDTLKIDLSFVQGMLQNDQDATIVSTIIDLAHRFDLSVVAEGVENQEILDALREGRCDQAQGYYISRPIDAVALEKWIQERFTDNGLPGKIEHLDPSGVRRIV